MKNNNRLSSAVKGLDKLISGSIPRESIYMITGNSGTLKSAFAFNLISNHLRSHPKLFGVYISLEQTKASLLRNMEGLGLTTPKNLQISDYATLKHRLDDGDMDYGSMILKPLLDNEGSGEQNPLKKPNYVILDSLNAFYVLMARTNEPDREKLQYLFMMLREKGITSFFIMETDPREEFHEEFFLVDGVIDMGIIKSQGKFKRYIQVKKMRSAEHSLDQYVLDIGKGGISILDVLLE